MSEGRQDPLETIRVTQAWADGAKDLRNHLWLIALLSKVRSTRAPRNELALCGDPKELGHGCP